MKVPADLAEAIAQKTSVAQGKWASARAAADFAAFAPVLEEVLKLKREEGVALASGADVYDAMLQDYEPGISSADLDNMFGAMRPGLIDLRAKILEKEPVNSLKGTFDDATQMRLARLLAQTFGYDLSKGRIDQAVHPFSSGSGRDVRITTRTDLDDPFNCIYSTIHEVGHGAYEQNVNPEFTLIIHRTGRVRWGSMKVNLAFMKTKWGAGQAFTAWLFDQMTAHFGDMGISNSYEFYKSVNRVNRGFIRTEADEVQYNLHILLRFDLERAMISGDLQGERP